MRTIAITNQKGGVGKTTTAINLGASLAVFGKRVLIIDMDPQGNATSGLGVEKDICVYHALIGKRTLKSLITPTEMENLFIVPSNISLIGAEVELSHKKNKERILKELLKDIKDFDYILIDCPPSLGFLTINALVAANSVLVPVQCEYFAMEGLAQLLHTINLVKKTFNPTLKIEGILLTMHDKRNNLSKQVEMELKRHFPKYIFKTLIPRNVRLSEAPSFGKSAITYDIKCPGSKSYLSLAKEVLRYA
ncbi:ParA family protein [Hippea maritima]|uniref:Cobyrinic acid ac-diamide synthase n=1 Tax=Hippea maritima (strain ATCC 700847 / DSM 10411 / MH2) TaxID=760142 RepID=F2LW35_HIPMA|nr:AAA family ATPase [Hippea maritima]AEA33969.1 Cobyrinic acid ac-diamide synthase [Hippea maritima DSM 10411]